MRFLITSLLALAASLAAQSSPVNAESLPENGVFVRRVIARQESSSISVTSAASLTQQLPSSTLTPTATPTDSTAQVPLATSIIDQQFATFTVNSGKQADGGVTSGSISLGCANCSTFGSMTFSGEGLSMENGTITGGIMNMEANGFGGFFQLDLSAAALKHSWTKTFVTYPVYGIALPAKIDAGIYLSIDGELDIALDENMNVTFGASFQVPDGSVISMDLTDITNSSQHGFTPSTGLQIDAIPFQANFSAPSLKASLALKPKLLFGFRSPELYAEAGAFLDIPKLGLEIASLSNVDSDCKPVNSTNNGTPIPANLGNATSIIPSADVDIGLVADAGVAHFGASDALMLGEASLKLPTACLLWDGSKNTLGPASEVQSSAAAASSSSGSGSGMIAAAPGQPEVHVWGMMWGLGVSLCLGMMLL